MNGTITTPTPTPAQVRATPNDALADLARLPVNAETVFASTFADDAELSADGRLDLLATLARQAGWLAARQIRVLAAIADHDDSVEEWATLEVSTVLGVAPTTAATLVHHAVRLTHVLTDTLTALAVGEITARHADILVTGVASVDDDTARAVEARVLPGAGALTPARFRQRVSRAVLALDPTGQRERQQVAHEQRRVIITADEAGMAQLWAYLPADGAATLRAAIEAGATRLRASAEDGRTLDQLRADALVGLGAAVLADPRRARWHGRVAAVRMTVAASTLSGQDDEAADLAGYGPISAVMARRLAEHAVVDRVLLTDEQGQVVGSTRTETGYRPTAALRGYVIDRDRECTFPTCARPAEHCDLDHLVPASHGGATSAANVHALCRRHHRAKHLAGWRPHRESGNATVWASPTGRCYRNRPEPLPPSTGPPVP